MTDGDKPAAATPHAGGRPPGKRDRKKGGRSHKARSIGQVGRHSKRILRSQAGVDGIFEGSALLLLQLVYRDPRLPDEIRMKAANSALPYESPRLTAIEHSGNIGQLSHEEALAALRAGKAKKGGGDSGAPATP